MSRYLVLWSANPAVWPTDPKQAVAVLEAADGGVKQLQKSGALADIGWLTAQDGFAIFEAGSKEQVLGMVHGFYPWYKQTVQEIVPFEHGVEAIMATARQLAGTR